MFDFAWSEIMLIGLVALIAIGPKDMPVAIKAVAGMIKKARRMAAEFQTHVDELMREADLHEVRQQIDEIRNFDIKGEVERNIDPDGSLRSTFASNPLEPIAQPAAPTVASASPVLAASEPGVLAHETHDMERPTDPAPPVGEPAPAFIPPRTAPAPVAAQENDEPPAFIPPGTHRA
jgi:sec-independent protein translocase protein TatB